MRYSKFFALVLFLMALLGFSIAARAADDSAASSDMEDSAVSEETSMEPSSVAATPSPVTVVEDTSAVSTPGNVTVDFKEADIQNVLRILSFKSGVNIVAGKDVTGSVTIRLVDVPWEKALDVVLKTYGYAYDRDGNIIRVTTLENLKKEELSTEVYTLNYSQSSEVEKSVKEVLSERGKVRSDARSNTIIVTDMPTSMQRVKKVIDRLDSVTPQVVIEAKVIETTLGDADRMGIRWSMHAALKGSARPTTFPFPAKMKGMARWFPEGRAPAETTDLTSGGAATTSETADFPSIGPAHSFPVVDKSEFQFGTLDFSEFQAVLDILKERTDTRVLSEPHVTTLNNQEAKVLVGELLAVPTFERNSTTGRMEITGYKDRELGVRLSVTPQINDENEIVVQIHPEITTLLGYDDLTAEIKAPRFSSREATTKVRIRDGQTIAIGGLIRETQVDSKSKVPVLGDIPLLDKVFSYSNKTVQKTDLLFFMTVHIVKEKPYVPVGHKVQSELR